jgi:hypothetical protein
VSEGRYIQWHDLFAVLDDGALAIERYDAIEAAMKEQAKGHPSGITCFVVLPKGATPPPQHIKDRVKLLLTRLEPSLAALAYVIEDTGFKAVAARTALIAMKIFMPHPYPIFVETSMEAALTRVLPHLKKGQTVTTDVATIASVIADARREPRTAPRNGPAAQVGKR